MTEQSASESLFSERFFPSKATLHVSFAFRSIAGVLESVLHRSFSQLTSFASDNLPTRHPPPLPSPPWRSLLIGVHASMPSRLEASIVRRGSLSGLHLLSHHASLRFSAPLLSSTSPQCAYSPTHPPTLLHFAFPVQSSAPLRTPSSVTVSLGRAESGHWHSPFASSAPSSLLSTSPFSSASSLQTALLQLSAARATHRVVVRVVRPVTHTHTHTHPPAHKKTHEARLSLAESVVEQAEQARATKRAPASLRCSPLPARRSASHVNVCRHLERAEAQHHLDLPLPVSFLPEQSSQPFFYWCWFLCPSRFSTLTLPASQATNTSRSPPAASRLSPPLLSFFFFTPASAGVPQSCAVPHARTTLYILCKLIKRVLLVFCFPYLLPPSSLFSPPPPPPQLRCTLSCGSLPVPPPHSPSPRSHYSASRRFICS